MANKQEATEASPAIAAGKPRKKLKVVIAIACIVLALAGIGLFAGFATGVLAPENAAAKYGLLNYIYEDDVTDYIETYKEQMGYGDVPDEQWAQFLAAYNLTPERLRASTIDQLLTDEVARSKCEQLGISVSEEEVDEVIAGYKTGYASGSDTIWAQTLEQYGQTEEGFAEGIKLSMLKQKLAEHEVSMPEASEDEVRQTIKASIENAISNEQSLLLKHTYCFRKSKSSSEGSLEESEDVEAVRQALLDGGEVNEESFAAIVSMYSDDDELRDSGGANGWDADLSGYSEQYAKALATVDAKGAVSPVFEDDEDYFFIWVSDTYQLPENSEEAQDINLDAMPEALRQYFEDVAAAALWDTKTTEYLANLTQDIDAIVYPMPADVPYNVDMSLADAVSGENDSSEDAPQETGLEQGK